MFDLLGHLVLALAIQAAVDQFARSRLAGACAATAWAIAREITQAEYRWIELFGAGRRANMPWWGGLDLEVWGKADPWLDFILPSLLVWAVVWWRSQPVSPEDGGQESSR